MSEQNPDNEAKPAEARANFGQSLRHAREQAGLSVEYVAAQLNLPEETVEAIENAELDRLPPAAFVQGYIRVYARVVDLDVNTVLKEFETSVPHEHEAELHPLSSLPHETSSQTPLIRLVTGFIAVLAVLVLIYSAYTYYSRKSEDMEQAAETGAGALQLPPEAPLGIEPESPYQTTDLPIHTPTETIAENGADTETAVAPAVMAERGTPALEPPAAERTTDPQPLIEQQPAVQARAEQNRESVAPVSVETVQGDVLVLEPEAESWAEIRDASGARKFYGLLETGRVRTITGVAPFDIFLGNAPAVRVNLNEIDVDMTKFTRSNNIAHFKVSVENDRAELR